MTSAAPHDTRLGGSLIGACVSKSRYRSQAKAQAVADRCTAQRGTPLRPYFCSLCMGYHLTKAELPGGGMPERAAPARDLGPAVLAALEAMPPGYHATADIVARAVALGLLPAAAPVLKAAHRALTNLANHGRLARRGGVDKAVWSAPAAGTP